MKLKIYLCAHNITQTDFAKQLGVSRSHLTTIIGGKLKPSKTLANLIEILTDGEVTADYMLNFAGLNGKSE